MCGIVGIISLDGLQNWQARQTWMNKALFVDTLRGKDSTGIACIPLAEDKGEEVIVYKKAVNGADFIELGRTEKLLHDIDKYRCVIGHNRAATAGKINTRNAHPFQQGSITMVHNGTMTYWTGLDHSFDVDSEAICHALSIKPAKEVLEQLDGAYALVWHDSLDDTIHFARNDERPFHFAYSKDKATLLFASEAWMISELAPAALSVDKVYQLVVGKHITIWPHQTDLSEYTVEDFTPYVPKKSWWYGDTKYGKKYPQGSTTKLPATTTAGEDDEILDAMGYFRGQVINFRVSSYVPYNNFKGTRGTMRGITSLAEGNNVGVVDKVEAYNVDDVYNSNYQLTGTVRRGVYRGTVFTLILDDVEFAYYASESSDGDTDDLDIKIVNSRGDEITQKEFDKLSKHGCPLCQGDVDAEDSEYLDWTADGRPLCLECTNANEIAEQEA